MWWKWTLGEMNAILLTYFSSKMNEQTTTETFSICNIPRTLASSYVWFTPCYIFNVKSFIQKWFQKSVIRQIYINDWVWIAKFFNDFKLLTCSTFFTIVFYFFLWSEQIRRDWFCQPIISEYSCQPNRSEYSCQPNRSEYSGQPMMFLSIVFLLLLFGDTVGACLFVVLLQGSQVVSGFGELPLLHALPHVPEDEGPLGEHQVELVIQSSPSLTWNNRKIT